MTAQRSSTYNPEPATSPDPRTRLDRDRPTPPDTAEGGTRVCDANEVSNILGELDGADRIALRLVYFRGLTQTQVAHELALPETTVRQCVARGMRELAARLERTWTAGTTPGPSQ